MAGLVPCGGCERNVEPATLFSEGGDGRDTCSLTNIPALSKLAAGAVHFEHHPCLEDGPWSMPRETIQLRSAVGWSQSPASRCVLPSTSQCGALQ